MLNAVNSSLWNKRGWTFQERVLSRRAIIITDFQTIFTCSQGVAYEELTYSLPHSRYYPGQRTLQSAEADNDGAIPGYIPSGRQHMGYIGPNSSDLESYFDCWWFQLMAIERLPSHPHLARRADVGRVPVDKWKDRNTRWETIVLC